MFSLQFSSTDTFCNTPETIDFCEFMSKFLFKSELL